MKKEYISPKAEAVSTLPQHFCATAISIVNESPASYGADSISVSEPNIFN